VWHIPCSIFQFAQTPEKFLNSSTFGFFSSFNLRGAK
jgi:hypothetical protein